MNWTVVRITLSGLPFRTYLLAFFVLYGVGMAAVVGRYGWNPTALVRFGHYYAEQNQRLTPPGAIEFLGNEHHGGNGYDGQIFYYYARTLWERNTWPRGFNNAYRAPRVGYPLLASALALPGIWTGNDALASWGTAVGLILVQLCLIPLGMLAFYRLLPAHARYLTAFFLAAPFTLQSALLLVSDGVMIALQMIGLYFFVGGRAAVEDGRALSALCRRPLDLAAFSLAGIAFSLAVLTKESSLFLLFPLGLAALLQRDFKRAALMVLVLFPMVAWQVYLRTAHGMIPAGVLGVFLSPLDGVRGLAVDTGRLLVAFLSAPSAGAFLQLMKHSAKVNLFFLIPAATWLVWQLRRALLPYGLAVIFALLSVLIADHYYFWSVYENISRMFTPLVPVVLLLLAVAGSGSGSGSASGNRDGWAESAYLLLQTTLFVLVVGRIVLLTPRWPAGTF